MTMESSSSHSSSSSLPWYLQGLKAPSCEGHNREIFNDDCMEDKGDEFDFSTSSFSRYVGPLLFVAEEEHHNPTPPKVDNLTAASEIIHIRHPQHNDIGLEPQIRMPFDNVTLMLVILVPVLCYYNTAIRSGFRKACYKTAPTNPPNSRNNDRSATTSQKRRKRRRRQKLDGYASCSSNPLNQENIKMPVNNELGSEKTYSRATTVIFDSTTTACHNLDNTESIQDIPSSPCKLSPTRSATKFTDTALYSPNPSKALVHAEMVTPIQYQSLTHYKEQVQMIASVVNSTGLDTKASLTLANETILRRLETNFQMELQNTLQSKPALLHQPIDDLTQIGFQIFPGVYFQACLATSILSRLMKFYLRSCQMNSAYDLFFIHKSSTTTIMPLATTLLASMCGCSDNAATIAISQQGDSYLDRFYYYFHASRPALTFSSLIQLQCWTCCFLKYFFSIALLYLLHRLLEMFHCTSQLHQMANLVACATLLLPFFQETFLILTISNTVLMMFANGIYFFLRNLQQQRIPCNNMQDSKAKDHLASTVRCIKSTLIVVAFSCSIVAGFVMVN